MSILLFVTHSLWSIIDDSGFVVSSVMPSVLSPLSFQQLTGKMGTRPFPPASRGMADIDDIATPLTLSAVCFWDPDLRTIPTFVARMSQMAQDACATLVLINALQG